MEEEIQAIFLDTNVFESAKFEYKDNNIEILFALCKDHSIPIYIDYVVEQEVLHRINENVKKSVEGLKVEQLHYLAKIFNIPTNIKEISKKLSEQLVKNFNDLKSEYLEILDNDISAMDIAKMYFENTAPFGYGIKKHEFPDAIIGTNIERFSNEESIEILAITNDKGLIEFFDNSGIQAVKFVSAAINIINKQFQTDTYFSNIKNNLKTKIVEYIKNKNIDLNLYAYDYQDTVYADNYEINDVNIDDVLLIERDNDIGSLIVSCPCILTIELTTGFYPDYENGTFDKEDHNWYCYNSKRTTHLIKKEIEITFELSAIENNGTSLYIDYTDGDLDIEFDLYGYETTIINEEYIDSSEREYVYN